MPVYATSFSAMCRFSLECRSDIAARRFTSSMIRRCAASYAPPVYSSTGTLRALRECGCSDRFEAACAGVASTQNARLFAPGRWWLRCRLPAVVAGQFCHMFSLDARCLALLCAARHAV